MSVQITIIGLGQVGSSIGLALAGQKNIKRVGHDKNYEAARGAQKIGAVDDVKVNLPASVSEAQVVILSLPLSEIRDTLGYIAQDLQEGTVILDTTPAKGKMVEWMSEMLPRERYYVGLAPAAGTAYLHGMEVGVHSARADLFKNGLFLVNAPAGTPGAALDLASNLVSLLGAEVMFTDAIEADGLLASTHLLPQLAGAALLDSTVNKPGWREARRIAARPYAAVTAAMTYHDEPKSLGDAALANRGNTVRVLDELIASLQNLRERIAEADGKGVLEYLEAAAKARDRWINERSKADWETANRSKQDALSFGDRLSQMFVGNLFGRDKKRK